MRRILLTGKNGQVGWELQRTLAALGEVITLDRHGMDLANPDSIRRVVREIKPALIINAAAYTAVDKAETEPELAMAINGTAPGVLAEEAKRLGAGIVHYSTDYVFDGSKNTSYIEEDIPNPLNVYGRTKLAGEQAIFSVGVPYLIFRTSWVYGSRGKNFLLTILRLARERNDLRIVDDQVGAPTWSRMIAEATAQILVQFYGRPMSHPSLLTDISGIYHMTAGGQTSWFGFAEAILNYVSGSVAPVPHLTPVTTKEYPTPAKRPRNSIMSNVKLNHQFGIKMLGWEIGLRLCTEEGKR